MDNAWDAACGAADWTAREAALVALDVAVRDVVSRDDEIRWQVLHLVDLLEWWQDVHPSLLHLLQAHSQQFMVERTFVFVWQIESEEEIF